MLHGVMSRGDHPSGEFFRRVLDMSSISTIALSGMNAATRRLDVAASNIANSRSSGALPAADGTVTTGAAQAYVPLQVVQSDVAGGGTQTTVTAVKPSSVASFDPQA